MAKMYAGGRYAERFVMSSTMLEMTLNDLKKDYPDIPESIVNQFDKICDDIDSLGNKVLKRIMIQKDWSKEDEE